MEKTQQFRIKNIQIAKNFQMTQSSLCWQGKSLCHHIKTADHIFDGEGLWPSFGAPMIITKDAHLHPLQIAKLSPFLTTQGITTALIMLDYLPSSHQLSGYARQLKNKTSVHVGWILPLSKDLSPSDIRQLENAPAVCGWYCDDLFINEAIFSNLAAVAKPLLIHAPYASVKHFHLLQQVLKATKKQGFITALDDDIQSTMVWLSKPKNDHYHLPYLVTHRPHLVQNFWQSWQEQYQQEFNVHSLSLMAEYITQNYQIINIHNKGRLHAGYDADMVLLDHHGSVQHVITHGEISLWKTEFTEQYAGSALCIANCSYAFLNDKEERCENHKNWAAYE